MISKGIKLSYSSTGTTTYTDLTNLQEIPDLGGDVDALENTVLSSPAHTYEDGLTSYGEALEFKFLYEGTQFDTLNDLEGSINWKVTIPDDSTFTFSGSPSVKFDGVGVNAVLTYTLSIRPSSEIERA